MPKSNKLPPEVVDHWPDIFEDIEIKAIPLKYVNEIRISFTEGNDVIIDIDQNKLNNDNIDAVEDSLENFFNEYDDIIDSVDFSLNTKQVKKDVEARTKRFMKKRK